MSRDIIWSRLEKYILFIFWILCIFCTSPAQGSPAHGTVSSQVANQLGIDRVTPGLGEAGFEPETASLQSRKYFVHCSRVKGENKTASKLDVFPFIQKK